MTVQEATIAKLQQMPEPLVQEVLDFIDFLLTRSDSGRWQAWLQFTETMPLSEAGMTDYLSSLQVYEEQLQRGEIKW